MNNSPIPFPSRAVCLDFARTHYASAETRCGNSLVTQALAIADRIDTLLTDHFFYALGIILPMQKLVIDSAYCSGLLHAALRIVPYSTFEQLVDIANLETANYVGAVTEDCRLPRPQRHRDLLGRLYEAPLPAQVVKLAELHVQVAELVALFNDKRVKRAEAKVVHRSWLIESQEVLGALQRVRSDESFLVECLRLNNTMGQLVKLCDSLSQREKILANIAAKQNGRHPSPAT